MERLDGVEEDRGGAGGRERGGELLPDVDVLADAGDDDLPAGFQAVEEAPEGARERVAEGVADLGEAFDFDVEDGAGGG